VLHFYPFLCFDR